MLEYPMVSIPRTLTSPSTLVLAHAESSLPRRPLRAPLARRFPRMPSPDKVSFESQQARSPVVHWASAVAIFALGDCMAATDMARARKVEMVAAFILVIWREDCV